MKDKAVLTLPLSPKKFDEYARLVCPVVGETIGKNLDANFYLCTNLLDSFGNREEAYKNYIQNIKDHFVNGIYWKDIDYLDQMLENIWKLIKLGFVYEKNVEILRCDCGIIEIEKKNLDTCNPEKSHYKYVNGKLFCPHCNNFCKTFSENVLVFDPSNLKFKDFNFKPNYLNMDIKTFYNIVLKSYIVVSRKRNTGIIYNYNGTNYNIDIDFLWETYTSLFPEKEKIILCGNRELYQLFLVNVLEKCLDESTESIYIGTPILTGINDFKIDPIDEDYVLTKKLAIIFNIKWNKKDKPFDKEILRFLKSMSLEKKQQLYELIVRNDINNLNFNEQTDKIMHDKFNMQDMLNNLKRERRKNV
jgi:hypothetical protein